MKKQNPHSTDNQGGGASFRLFCRQKFLRLKNSKLAGNVTLHPAGVLSGVLPIAPNVEKISMCHCAAVKS